MRRSNETDWAQHVADVCTLLVAAVRLHREGVEVFCWIDGQLYGKVSRWVHGTSVPRTSAARAVDRLLRAERVPVLPYVGTPLDLTMLRRYARRIANEDGSDFDVQWSQVESEVESRGLVRPGRHARAETESERVADEVLETSVCRLLEGRGHPFRRGEREIRVVVSAAAALRNQSPHALAAGMRMKGLWQGRSARDHTWNTRGRPIDVKAFLDYVRSRPDMDVRQVARALRALPQTPKPRVGRPPTKALERYAELCEQGLPIPDALLKKIGKSS